MEEKAARPAPRPSEFGKQYAVDRAIDRMVRAIFDLILTVISREGFILVFGSGCRERGKERAERVLAEEERRVVIVPVGDAVRKREKEKERVRVAWGRAKEEREGPRGRNQGPRRQRRQPQAAGFTIRQAAERRRGEEPPSPQPGPSQEAVRYGVLTVFMRGRCVSRAAGRSVIPSSPRRSFASKC